MKKSKSHGQRNSGGMRAASGAAAYKKAMGEEGLLKTGHDVLEENLAQPPRRQAPNEKTGITPSKNTRAAQFMVLIGSDEASKILSKLAPKQVEAISKEIVTLKTITPKEAEDVLQEFRSLLSSPYGYSGSSSGGIEQARRLLYAAFGPEKGETMLVKAVPGAAENPFDFLSEFSGEQISMLFKDESPAACAMVFSRLPSKLSAAALANTTPRRKLEIVKRIAKLNDTSPEVIASAAAAIREKARHFGQSAAKAGEEIDGKGVLTAILKHSDIAFSGKLLDGLEESDPSLSKEMKDRLYTLEDVANAADRPLQEKLRSMDDKEIALLLRGRSEAFIQKIIWNLSSARAGRIKEESEIMGAVPRIEAEAAAREFLAWFRQSLDEGRILMLTDKDVMV